MSRRKINRVARRWPLFAAEFCSAKGLDSTGVDFDKIPPKNVKKKSRAKSKKALKKYGRYTLMQAHLEKYNATKDIEHLAKAQQIRKRLSSPYYLKFNFGLERLELWIAPRASWQTVLKLSKFKGQLEDFRKELSSLAQYGTISGSKLIQEYKGESWAVVYDGPIYEKEYL